MPGTGIRPFGEIGTWFSPDASFTFTRSYANGAGTATAQQRTNGSMHYEFGRLGVVVPVTPTDEAALSVEYGRAGLSIAGYQEGLSNANPFPATIASSSNTLGIGKIEGQWTHRFSDLIDATVTAGYADGFRGP